MPIQNGSMQQCGSISYTLSLPLPFSGLSQRQRRRHGKSSNMSLPWQQDFGVRIPHLGGLVFFFVLWQFRFHPFMPVLWDRTDYAAPAL